MKSVVIYPSYECNLACSYCWVQNKGFTQGLTHSLDEWADILQEKDILVDIVGGEPTLLDGLYEFCTKLPKWAMTTNMVDFDVLRGFAWKPLHNCIGIIGSWHEQMEWKTFLGRVLALRGAGYNASWSYVSPHIKPLSDDGAENPLIELEPTMVKPRMCNAGERHVSITPNGDIYRCQVFQMIGLAKGNLFTDGLIWDEAKECCLSCIPCYNQRQFGVIR